MLKSMTGFGRCEITTEEYKISVEMKAVNHRYLDLSIKMPKKFNFFENKKYAKAEGHENINTSEINKKILQPLYDMYRKEYLEIIR